jgi:hypothetical protein
MGDATPQTCIYDNHQVGILRRGRALATETRGGWNHLANGQVNSLIISQLKTNYFLKKKKIP